MYLSNCLWTDRPEENKAIIKILQLILRPSQKLTDESSDMLNSVRNIVAKPLENGLRTYQRVHPKSLDVEPLLQVLRENIELSRRTGAAGDKELETWTNAAAGGLTANIKLSMHNLTMWSMHQSVNMMPTQYTHRQVLVGLRMLGARRVLRAILEELKSQTEAASGSIAYGYDVAVSLVCAPDAAVHERLRDALRWDAEEWKKTQKHDSVMAEIVVRLHQRVEKQMTPVAMAIPDALDDTAAAMVADALVVGDEAAAAAVMAAAAADPMNLDSAGVLDLGAGAGDLSLGDAGAGSAGGLDLGDDDWGALGSLDGWDGSMDLT